MAIVPGVVQGRDTLRPYGHQLTDCDVTRPSDVIALLAHAPIALLAHAPGVDYALASAYPQIIKRHDHRF